MKLYELWQVAPANSIFIKKGNCIEKKEYMGDAERGDKEVKGIEATSFPMYQNVILVELEG